MIKVVGIKFKNGGKLYYFAPKEGEVYERNMPVIVETSRGIEYAWVAYPEREIADDEIVSPLKPVLRIATQKDIEKYKSALKQALQADDSPYKNMSEEFKNTLLAKINEKNNE